MNLELLSLLETPTVRKLVATWPLVPSVKTPSALFVEWSKVSAIHPKIARKWYVPLLQAGIIRGDRTIDFDAANYIASVAFSMAKVTRPVKRKLDS